MQRRRSKLEGDDSALLRLKARSGDAHSDVIGQVFESLLNLEGEPGLTFVSGFLESPDMEICEEAALAIAASRLPSARRLERRVVAWQRRQGLYCEWSRVGPSGNSRLPSLADSRRRATGCCDQSFGLHRDSRDIADGERSHPAARRWPCLAIISPRYFTAQKPIPRGGSPAGD
jgi:hypothetical protein